VGVAAQWVRLLNQHGHDAMFITPNGDPSPYWLNFKVPAGSYADVKDEPQNKIVHIWLDCLQQFQTKRAQLFYYAQDVAQPMYVDTIPGRFINEFLPLLKKGRLITIGQHSSYYYRYCWRLPSVIVPNFVDCETFKPANKLPASVCMIDHRDHFDSDIAQKIIDKGLTLKIAGGSQEEVAKTMGECIFFLSAAKGRDDGTGLLCEGFPMPFLEAMASGCAVLSRNLHGTSTFMIHNLNGFFWDDDNLDAWIQWMADKWNDGSMRMTSIMSVNTARQSFNLNGAWGCIRAALELK
jgi:glycosyltransferase involved in cell wall biosynthesis